jgi:hypothetical protein
MTNTIFHLSIFNITTVKTASSKRVHNSKQMAQLITFFITYLRLIILLVINDIPVESEVLVATLHI